MTEVCWTRAVTIDDLRQAGNLVAQDIGRFKLAIYAVNDEVFITADLCTHGGARLSQGYLEEYEIECPLHQGRFDIRTGAVTAPPCTRKLRVYPVRIENGVIFAGLPPEAT